MLWKHSLSIFLYFICKSRKSSLGLLPPTLFLFFTTACHLWRLVSGTRCAYIYTVKYIYPRKPQNAVKVNQVEQTKISWLSGLLSAAAEREQKIWERERSRTHHGVISRRKSSRVNGWGQVQQKEVSSTETEEEKRFNEWKREVQVKVWEQWRKSKNKKVCCLLKQQTQRQPGRAILFTSTVTLVLYGRCSV